MVHLSKISSTFSVHIQPFKDQGFKLQKTSLVGFGENWLVTWCHCSLVSDVNSGNCWIYIKYFHPSMLFWKDPRGICAFSWWKIKDADQENCSVEMLLALGLLWGELRSWAFLFLLILVVYSTDCYLIKNLFIKLLMRGFSFHRKDFKTAQAWIE